MDLINFLSNFLSNSCLNQIIVAITLFLLMHGVYLMLAYNFEKLVFYTIRIIYFIITSIDNLISRIAKMTYSEDYYIHFYNNSLKKRGLNNFDMDEYNNFLMKFRFNSFNKLDLCSIFQFIYGEVTHGPLRFFCKKYSVLEIEIIFYFKDVKKENKIFTIEYDFESESDIYNYKHNKLEEISKLFKLEGEDILNKFCYVEILLTIN